MELGVYSFVDIDPRDAEGPAAARRVRELMEEIALADEVGLDVFGVGEHHRPDYVSSAPATLLAGAATTTSRIRLTSAVSVLSSDDPVRVFQQFATLDLLSGGRAEILAGRGSFTESFPVFGLDLGDYDALFAEKLDLLLALRDGHPVTWPATVSDPDGSGRGGRPVPRHRPALDAAEIRPRPLQDPLPVWVAVGGNPESVVRAGAYGVPLALAILGGRTAQFAPLVELHREALRRAGHAPQPVGINTQGFVAATSQAARSAFYPGYAESMGRIGRERGWGPTSPAAFEAARAPEGALAVGSPEEVTEKLLAQHEVFGHDRYLMQTSVGPTPHAEVMRSIELLGTEVAPRVRADVARRAARGTDDAVAVGAASAVPDPAA